MQRTGAAEPEKGETTGIVAPLQGDHLDGASHILGCDLDDRGGKLDRAHFGPASEIPQRHFSQARIETHPTAEETVGIETTQVQICVGDGWLRATQSIAGRSWHGAGSLRTDPQEPSRVDPGDAAATSADRLDVDQGDRR